MRRAVLSTAAAVLLVGPTVLAFFTGGYFEEARLIATLGVWALMLVAALASPRVLPVSWPGRAALGGLAVIALWTGASLAWAPLSEPASASFVRLLLYVGALAAAAALLRDRRSMAAVEPAIALGAVMVIGYGLAGRLLPGAVHLAQSLKAYGRLEQPITYWNAEGMLAAFGLVLCARLAGSDFRPAPMRIASAATAVPLALGVYLSYSRGAIAAALVGAAVLVAAAPSGVQLRALGISLAGGLVAVPVAAALPGVASLEGTLGQRESDGVVMLAVLAVLMLTAGVVQAWVCSAERRQRLRTGPLRFARRLPAAAAVAATVALAGLVVAGLSERRASDQTSRVHGIARLASVESLRYDYWRVGVRAFAEHPLRGLGGGGFRAVWLRERPVAESALEVHSLPLEMAAELGLPGLLGLGLFLGGIAVAAGRALRRRHPLAAGACAATTVWFLHATIDWDWQIPAVTLPTLIVAGALVAASEAELAAGAACTAAAGAVPEQARGATVPAETA